MPKISIHATNLLNPNHMEWTNDGRLLVSEYTAGQLKDVTQGGDMSKVKPYAQGLAGPASILPLPDGKILVAESWDGKITDVSGGGDVSKTQAYITGRSNPYSLLKTGQGSAQKLYVSEYCNGPNSWVTDITDPNKTSTYIDNIPVRPSSPGPVSDAGSEDWKRYTSVGRQIVWLGGDDSAHFLSIGGLGQIFDVTKSGGDYNDLVKNKRAVAWGLGSLGGFKKHPVNGLIYVTEPERGDVVAINPKKPTDMGFQPPVVRGFNSPTCVRFSADGSTMYVCAQGDGVIWKVTEFE